MLEVTTLPARLDFRHWKGDDLDVTIEVYSVSGTTETPVDFTGYTATMVWERPGNDTAVLSISTSAEITFPAAGQIRIQVTDTALDAALDLGKYDIRIKLTSAGGLNKTYFAGSFKFEYK